MSHANPKDSMPYTEGSVSHTNNNDLRLSPEALGSQAQSSFAEAQQRQKISKLESKLLVLELGHIVKESRITIWPKDKASEGYIVTDLSFLAFVYEKYTANTDNLEEGLFKGKILLQGYKAIFTSPSSTKDIEGNGDGTDVIANNQHAKQSFCRIKVKKYVAQIIKMDKVTPRSITYVACQVEGERECENDEDDKVTSWWSIDNDFDYIQFWWSIVDLFEKPPGREAQFRVNKLLEWWTRKVFGRSRHKDLSNMAKASMSINALASQRAQIDDAAFDSN
ncbi:uncharacterized protein EDB93DRAFT_1257071 [Suillus bovinus]|uniref:uncharacterized protein n=1 Tax=Suillus bovinus TaxID=48563 RepID=UPI001B8632EF|nr:uncharacterized protein EDB93DRAFT_1257071 [Suillus bovinus]KAG2127287.1 hypothetical protein EDB93DRAFT_1257071 [Suillus bovinus]